MRKQQALVLPDQPIYPLGPPPSHFVVGTPDNGQRLLSGDRLQLVLDGRHPITGSVRWSEQGDYLETATGAICGLYPTMRVALLPRPHNEPARPRPARHPRLRWTISMVNRLVSRYLELAPVPQPRRQGLYAVGRRVALEFGWPVQPVWSKLTQLREELSRRQLATQAVCDRDLAEPVPLANGSRVWTVLQGFGNQNEQERASWLLDYQYGCFPLAPGCRCVFAGTRYRVSGVGTSQISVAVIASEE